MKKSIKKLKKPRSEFDAPWKEVLDIYFEQFVAYCWPQHYSEIDWSKSYISLDKELAKIARSAAIGNKVADKLIKVCLKNGEEAYILIHIEVQRGFDSSFEDRMYTSRYRIRDSYKKPIASLAILIDTDKNWRPICYREELWGSSVEMKFPIIKLIDYQDRIEELEKSANPFVTVILAQLTTMKKESPEDMLINKVNLIKRLYLQNWKKEDVLTLFKFIDWVFALPTTFEVMCKKQIEEFEEELHVNYVTSFERISREEGRQEGRNDILLRLLQHKFNIVPEQYLEKIEKANTDTVQNWAERVLDCYKLEEVFED